MLTTAMIKKLKQVNISRDAEKTKSRIKEVYEGASRKEKQAMIELSGQNRNSFYRAERTGNASAKIILPLAQVAGVSPYWLMGVSNSKDTFSEEVLAQFLNEYGYAELAGNLKAPQPKKQRKPRTPKAAPVAAEAKAEEAEQVNVLTVEFSDSPQMRDAVEALDLESATQLLGALFLRAKAGGKAQQLCVAVKYCLLS